MVDDLPCVQYREKNYVDDIDVILSQLDNHGLLVESKDVLKPLLLEFHKYIFYFDYGSKYRVESICNLLVQLDSPIRFYCEY